MKNEQIVSHLYEVDYQFKRCLDQHMKLEQDLEALYSLKAFPPVVEDEIKKIKIEKLQNKDTMDKIIEDYKKSV